MEMVILKELKIYLGKFSIRARKFFNVAFSGIREIGYEKISFSVLKEEEIISTRGNKIR
jgi:hypothetical protein